MLLVRQSSTRKRLILNSYIYEISSFHTWWKYPENSGAFLRFRGVSYFSGKEIGKTAFTFPGRRERTRIRSAILIASERSWVISKAVFRISKCFLKAFYAVIYSHDITVRIIAKRYISARFAF